MHLGSCRTALFCYLFAKKHGGDFILRIEDTDTARTVPGAEQYIIDSLKWCGIEPNEGIGTNENSPGTLSIYRQSDRNKSGIYNPYIAKLVAQGNAYYAFDTPEEIEEFKKTIEKSGVKTPFSYNSFTREKLKNSLTLSKETVLELFKEKVPFVIRLKMPKGIEIKFKDIVRGDISVKSHNMDDKVLMKSDGMPTYHLANVVDDHLMEISHVIRGEEWCPSAPSHCYLYQCLGWELPEFAHLPNVLTTDGKKISKRFALDYNFPIFPINYTDPTGNISKGFKEMGFLPDAFNNMLALLGWSPGGNVEVMSMEEMIDKFTLEKVGKSGAKFDFKKANWINHQHLLKMNDIEIGKMFLELQFNSDNSEFRNWALDGGDTDEKAKYVDKVCGLLKEKVSNLNDFWESGKYFFVEPDESTIPVVLDYVGDMEGFAGVITGWLDDKLENKKEVEHDDVKKAFDYAVTASNVDARDAGRFLRFAITGMKVGPPIFDIIPLLGVEVSLKRMMKVLQLHAQNK